ncbi:MAG: ATP-binding protein [Pseudomonadota bacterium]
MTDRRLLQDFFQALPQPTLAIDENERIVAANDAAAMLMGHQTLGRHFVTALRQPSLVDAVERALRDGVAREASYLAGDLSKEQSYRVTMRRSGEAQALILTFEDVTHEAEAGQMRRDFVANVSHELRTPLTALIGFIETLSGPARDDAAARQRFLDIMATEAGRMNRLVGDLLSLSRVESEERVRPKDRVNLADVLRTALRNLNPLAVDNDVVLQPDFADHDLMLLGDADQLLQVFTNLIENAIKYGGQGQRVDIKSETAERDSALRGPALRVTVRDHGPGIDPMHLPRLTERFYRADSHRSRALGGTGLGLAIVKHILNRHRGRLRISSHVGQGAAFTVILPRETQLPVAEAAL